MQPTWSNVLASIENMLQIPEAVDLQRTFALWLSHAVRVSKRDVLADDMSTHESLREMFTNAIKLTSDKVEKLQLLLVLQYALHHSSEVMQASTSQGNFTWPALTPEEKCDLSSLQP